jgi:hypothetical protein
MPHGADRHNGGSAGFTLFQERFRTSTRHSPGFGIVPHAVRADVRDHSGRWFGSNLYPASSPWASSCRTLALTQGCGEVLLDLGRRQVRHADQQEFEIVGENFLRMNDVICVAADLLVKTLDLTHIQQSDLRWVVGRAHVRFSTTRNLNSRYWKNSPPAAGS